MRHCWAIAAALLAMTAPDVPAIAQQPSKAQQGAMHASDTATAAGHYLAAVRALEPLAFNNKGKPVEGPIFQFWAQLDVMLTAERAAVSPYPPQRLAAGDAAQLGTATTRDALTEIVRRARDTSIVFLNEEHDDPRGRAFGLEVARALRPLGYATLAFETLSNDADASVSATKMAALVHDGYVRRTSGFYSKDPVFADFIRQALSIGYRPVAYEQTRNDPGIAAREQAEAEYLIARALPKGSRDKLLVYVGYSHAAEAPLPAGKGPPDRWLASRVKAMTGIDPLTIDQVSFAEISTLGRGNDRYALLRDHIGTHSAVLMRGGTPLIVGQYAGAMDLQVLHPPVRHVDGRPDWLATMGRVPQAIPPALLPVSGTRLVQAFGAGEAADAVPIDQVLVTAGQPAPKLMLPPDRAVRYAVEDAPTR